MHETENQPTNGQAGTRTPSRWAWALAVGVTALVAAQHVRFALRAGPLWRDEVSSVGVANSPSLGDLYRHLPLDSNLLFGHAVLRAWMHLGPGDGDRSLRALGLLVGLGTVAALWRNARLFGAAVPALSVALLNLGGAAVCFGDSIRPNGLGTLLGLLCMGALFQAATVPAGRPARRSLAVAAGLSLAAVHTSFYGTVWLLALGIAAAAVCAMGGRYRRALAVLGIGAGCAASMVVYLPMIRGRAAFAPLFVKPTTVPRVLGVLRESLALAPFDQPIHGDWIWAAAVAFGLAAACWPRRAGPGGGSDRRSDARRFGLFACAVGVPAYVAFLDVLSNQMLQSYFVPLMALVACGLDGMTTRLGRRSTGLVMVAALAASAWTASTAWRAVGMRMSDVDLAAAQLARYGQPGDAVVITPWWMGTTFTRYYRGPVEVLTVPPVPQLGYARFDLLMQTMARPDPVGPVLDRIAAVGRAGHRVWLIRAVGITVFSDPRVELRPPGPSARHDDYYLYWDQRVGRAIRESFDLTRAVQPPMGDHVQVNPLERVELIGFPPR